MRERERRRDSAATISGKRWVRSLPGRLYSLTCAPLLRAMTRKPSCLISCSHLSPDGSLSVLVGRHGAMNPAGLGTIAAHLNVFYLRVSREQSVISSPGRVRVMKALTRDR